MPSPKKVAARLGEEITVTQPSNPTTGFEWVAEFDKSRVALVKSEYRGRGGGQHLIGIPKLGNRHYNDA